MPNQKSSQAKKTQREILREKRRKEGQRRRLTALAIISGIALLVSSFLIYQNNRPVGEIVQPTPRTLPNPDGTTMGDPDAPVMLEEFADFQCPTCGLWAETIEPRLVEEYVQTGKVYYVFRNAPFIGNESFQAANASLCAADQDRFWDYHDILFANQTGENVGDFRDDRLVAFAETLGLDMQAFNQCFDENSHSDQITQDLNQWRGLGLSSTPSFALNGQAASGISYEDLQGQIEALLAASGG